MFISKRCNCFSKLGICCGNGKNSEKLSKDLGLLSVKSRLDILFLLKDKPHCVCDLAAHTGMSQSLISHHLADLIKSQLIGSSREGKFVEYFLAKKGIKVIQALDLIRN